MPFFSDEKDFKMTKLLLDFGGDLNFETWWSTDDVGITVGQGDQSGNAIQLIWVVRKQKERKSGRLNVEHVDELLQSLKIKASIYCISDTVKAFKRLVNKNWS